MRKLIYGGLFTTLVAIAFIGCEKENSVDKKNVSSLDKLNLELSENPEKVGIIHNETLDYVYNQLKDLGFEKRNNLTEEELMTFTKEKSIEYLMTYTKDAISYEDINDFIMSLRIKPNLKSNSLVQSYGSQLLIGSNFLSIDDHNSKVNSVIQTASSDIELSTDDLNQIIAFGSVATNPHQYWEANSEDWNSLFEEDGSRVEEGGSRALPPGYKGRIVDADIDGAITGAVTGLLGGWIGSLLGAALSSPISSAWQGIKEYNS